MTPPLVAFDFDGTLAEAEMIDELAVEAGVGDEVAAITDRAMRGELSYPTSLRERVDRLSGLDVSSFTRAVDGIELRSEAPSVINTIRSAGVSVAVITGAFRRGVERILAADGVQVDMVLANELVMADGRLTGVVRGPLVEGTKDAAFERCVEQVGATPGDAVAVGDGANDIPMLAAAGLAIGIDPKPAVAEVCDHELDSLEPIPALSNITR